MNNEKAVAMVGRMQQRIDTQKQIISTQKNEIMRLRNLCEQAGVDWRHGPRG